jgi:hypothetical protein
MPSVDLDTMSVPFLICGFDLSRNSKQFMAALGRNSAAYGGQLVRQLLKNYYISMAYIMFTV